MVEGLLRKWQQLLDLTHWDIAAVPVSEIGFDERRFAASIRHEYGGEMFDVRRGVLVFVPEMMSTAAVAEREVIIMLAHLIC